MCATLVDEKPIVTVIELDREKGGASVDDMKAECRRSFPAPQPDSVEPDVCAVIARVFAKDPVLYLRLHAFQARRFSSLGSQSAAGERRPPPFCFRSSRSRASTTSTRIRA